MIKKQLFLNRGLRGGLRHFVFWFWSQKRVVFRQLPFFPHISPWRGRFHGWEVGNRDFWPGTEMLKSCSKIKLWGRKSWKIVFWRGQKSSFLRLFVIIIDEIEVRRPDRLYVVKVITSTVFLKIIDLLDSHWVSFRIFEVEKSSFFIDFLRPGPKSNMLKTSFLGVWEARF